MGGDENSAIKYFLFERETKNGNLKTDKFTVDHVIGPSLCKGWLHLKLRGMKNRWVKVSKSLDFLDCLLTQDGAMTSKSKHQDEAIDYIEEAIDYATPRPTEPNLTFVDIVRKMWNAAFGEQQ